MRYETPTVEKVYIAPNATLRGDVTLGEDCSIWYGAVLRGDHGSIVLGKGVNIQDNCILHDAVWVGKNTSVGHAAILHGCEIGEGCLIGMGAIVLDGAKIGPRCLVGAGALVTGKMNAPEGSLLLGSPARVVRPLTDAELETLRSNAEHYICLGREMARDEAENAKQNGDK